MKSLSDYKINEKKGNRMHVTSVNIIKEYESCYLFLLYIVHDSQSELIFYLSHDVLIINESSYSFNLDIFMILEQH